MTDITTRLRAAVAEIMHYQFTHGRPAMNALQDLIDDAEAAADEIERLRAALTKLDALLRDGRVQGTTVADSVALARAAINAREALGGT